MFSKLFEARKRFLLPLAFLAVLGLESIDIGRPSLWADEVATVSAADRPLPELFHLLQRIDAVHGTYYLFMHFWGRLFGFDPFALRFPSAVAVALTTVIVFLIAKKLFGTRVGWFALLIAAFLPRLAWAATEARSYAFDAFVGACLVLTLIKAVEASDRRRKRIFILYVVILTLGIHLFAYFALAGLAQGVWLFWRKRALVKTWLIAYLLSVALSGYLLFWAVLERGQVKWLPAVGAQTPAEVLVGQSFLGNSTLALLANGLILALLLGARFQGKKITTAESDNLKHLGLFLVVPTTAVLLVSVLSKSIYDARYFTFTGPVVAILLATSLDRLFSKRVSLVGALLAVTLSVPGFLSFRTVDAKGTDWTEVAHMVGKLARPGDGVMYTDFMLKSPLESRISIAFPRDFKNLTDLTQEVPYSRAFGLFAKRMPITQARFNPQKHPRILVIESSSQIDAYRSVTNVLDQNGYKFTDRVRVSSTWIDIFQYGQSKVHPHAKWKANL